MLSRSKNNTEKNIYHGQFTQVAKLKRAQKCKKTSSDNRNESSGR